MKLSKWNISRKWRRLRANRKFKDKLFRKIFENKKDLLTLYNAVNHTSYTNVDDLEITTLDDTLYLGMKNDVSFLVSATMNLYEHQSTVNYNMPLRGLEYLAKMLSQYIEMNALNVYQKKMIRLPRPQYVVFYNGRETQPDEQIVRLSDAFEPGDFEPALECRARMININMGCNQELLDSCKRLHDYSYFIAEINQNLDSGMKLERAIEQAMDVCIQKDILREILEKSKSEVYGMLLTEFNEKKYRKLLLKEGFEEGQELGKVKTLIGLVRDGILTVNIAADRAGMTIEQFQQKMDELI